MLGRILTSPWNAVLFLLALVAMVISLPELPTTPREGWSDVGVFLHGHHRGVTPGTPFYYGPYRQVIWETTEGEYVATQNGRGIENAATPAGFVEFYIHRLRQGFLAPTRETWSRTIYYRPVRDQQTGELREVPEDRRTDAISAVINLRQSLIDADPDRYATTDMDLIQQLELIRAGEMTSERQPIPAGVAANMLSIAFAAVMLLTLPGALHALAIGLGRATMFIRVHRDHRRRCRKCAYDLTGIDAATCPECGARLKPSDRTQMPK